jgi:excisionase family DNA binding protein
MTRTDIPDDLRMFEGDVSAHPVLEIPVPVAPAYAQPTDMKIKQAAFALNVHPNTLKRMLKLGMVIGAYRIGSRGDWRIPISALDSFKSHGGSRG